MKYTAILIALFMGACSSGVEETNSSAQSDEFTGALSLTPEQMKNASLETRILEMGSMPGTLTLYGKVVSASGAVHQVVFPYGGIVEGITLQPGSFVSQGQTIARIRNKELLEIQSEYLTSLSSLELLEKELERQRILSSENAGSGKNYEQALHAVKTERIHQKLLAEKLSLAGLDASKLDIKSMASLLEIKSPVAGTIAEVFATNGQFLGPESGMMQIVGQSLKAELTVTGADLRHLEKGLNLIIRSEGDTTRMNAVIETISPLTDNENTVRVYCAISNPVRNLQQGARLTSELYLRDQDGLLLPAEAIVSWKNKKYIFLKTAERTFEMKPIDDPTNFNDSMAILHSDFDLLRREYVSKNAYTLLMMIANKEE